jgi:hypothetical protein
MTDFINSNYIRAEDLAENVLIEAVIADVKRKEFEENGEVVIKPVVALEDGCQVTLNQTRLMTLIGAYGHNSDNWIGKTVIIKRGTAMYAGKTVPAVKLEPIVAPKVAAEPRLRLVTVESSKGAPAEQAPPLLRGEPASDRRHRRHPVLTTASAMRPVRWAACP